MSGTGRDANVCAYGKEQTSWLRKRGPQKPRIIRTLFMLHFNSVTR